MKEEEEVFAIDTFPLTHSIMDSSSDISNSKLDIFHNIMVRHLLLTY